MNVGERRKGMLDYNGRERINVSINSDHQNGWFCCKRVLFDDRSST